MSQGLKLLEANFRCRLGEIDLVMQAGATLIFVEVRYRSSDRFGGALASITAAKQQRLRRAAGVYLARHPDLAAARCRFDVVAVSKRNYRVHFEWIRDAFAA